MVASQRHAIYNLVVSLAALGTFLALLPFFGSGNAQVGFALLALTGLGPLLFFRRRGAEVFDERERAIFLRATQIGFIFFWLLFVAGAMGAYLVLSHRSAAMPVDMLPLVVWLGWVALLVCHSTAVLSLHWWSNRGAADIEK